MIIRATHFTKALLILSFLTATAVTYAQGGRISGFENYSDESYKQLLTNVNRKGYTQAALALSIARVLDPANHECCISSPPETVEVQVENDEITVSSSDPDHWFNFTAPLDQTSPIFEAETSTTVAGIANVRNTFSGEIFPDGIAIEVVLGVDGELFDETIEYTLEIDSGDLLTLTTASFVSQATVDKVRTASGSNTNASFTSGASVEGEDVPRTSFDTSEEVTIVGTINIDPSDQGSAGEVHVVLLSVNTAGVDFSFMNSEGNFENWDLTIPGLGAYVTTDSLKASYTVIISQGTLLAGTYRVALAYSKGAELIYAPKAIVITVQ